MTDQLPTMDDLHDAYAEGYDPEPRFGNTKVREARVAGIAAVIDRLDAWHLVAPQSRPIPEGWSNETPPHDVRVVVSNKPGGSGQTWRFGRNCSWTWPDYLKDYPAAIWHPLPVDPRVES